MKRNPKSKNPKKVGLLTSILLIFFAALVVSISLTVVLFSLMGKVVYGRVLANGMRPQARVFADTTVGLFEGELSSENFRFMMRSSETTIVVLDMQKEPVFFSEPRREDMGENDMPVIPPEGERPVEQGGMQPGEGPRPQPGNPDDGLNEDRFNTYVDYCKGIFEKAVSAESYSEYTEYPSHLGVIVALPVVGSGGEKLGALFLIKPVNDIAETSQSVLIVLVISSLIAAVLMILPIYLISRWLTDPLKKLNERANEFSSGDMSGRVLPDGSREISELGETFNVLADNLERMIGELTVERNRLRAVLEGLSEGLIAVDSEGNMINHNCASSLLLGGEADTDPSLLPQWPQVKKELDSALKTGESSIEAIECGERVIRVSAAPVDREGGRVVGAIALLMDMTEAERLEQTRRDYVANVSHELRTPLASIRGIADMLNDGLVRREEDKQRYYGYILKESIRLSTLINDLLELSRLQSGAVAPEVRRVELYELIADVADRTQDPASARGMSIDITVPEGRYYARTNPDRVEQALISLMDNAVKHGEEGGVIRVGLEEGEKWNVWVENPAEVDEGSLDHLFERFYKADIAHTGEGTGLGLAITEEVLRVMDESIRVDYKDGVIRFTFTVTKYEQ